MPAQPRFRHIRLIAATAAVAALVGFGLADYEGGSSGYTVQPGDSLWGIAAAHHLTVAQLASANRLNPNAILPIGKHLTLPSPGTSVRSSGAEVASAPIGGGSSNPWTFCSTFRAAPGPWGVLPPLLAASPSRLDLQPLFEKWAYHYGLSLPLLEAVAWQESGWQEGVVSPTGAVGIGQIEPSTGQFIANVLIGEPMNASSVSDNIRMSAAFLSYLAHIEGNNRCATIAAYYEGPLNLGAYGVLPESQTYVADVEALIPRFE